MTAGISQMVIDLIEDGTIDVADQRLIFDAIARRQPGFLPKPLILPNIPAHPAVAVGIGQRARIREISPKYLVGITGIVGREPRQQNRVALYLDAAEIARIDKRAVRYLRPSHYQHGRQFISVTRNMLEPA